jgi:hypothetical protein
VSTIGFLAPKLRRLEQCPATVLGAFLFEERGPLRGLLSLVDWRLHGHLSRLIIDGFASGAVGETLLVPLERRLSQRDLLIVGLGGVPRALEADEFCAALEQLFASVVGLGHESLALCLPGRPEELVETVQALEWLLEAHEPRKAHLRLHVCEPTPVQKAMQPLVERWRLRQLVP